MEQRCCEICRWPPKGDMLRNTLFFVFHFPEILSDIQGSFELDFWVFSRILRKAIEFFEIFSWKNANFLHSLQLHPISLSCNVSMGCKFTVRLCRIAGDLIQQFLHWIIEIFNPLALARFSHNSLPVITYECVTFPLKLNTWPYELHVGHQV